MTTSPLPFSARMTVYRRALGDAGFLARVKADPRSAIAEATGIALPEGLAVTTLIERPAEVPLWLPPEGIDVAAPANAVRPALGADRDIFDGFLLNALANDPGLRSRIKTDPQRAMVKTLGFGILARFVVVEETSTQLYVVIPDAVETDELDDALLDVVSGGATGIQYCEGTGCSK